MYQILLFIATIYVAVYLLKAVMVVIVAGINWEDVERKLILTVLEVIFLVIPSLLVLLHYMITQVLT